MLLLVNGIPVNNVVNGGLSGLADAGPQYRPDRNHARAGFGPARRGCRGGRNQHRNQGRGRNRRHGGGRLRTEVFETAGAWLQSGGRWENIEAAFSVEASTTGGYRKIIEADDQTRIDRLLGTRASLAPGPLNTPRRRCRCRLTSRGKQWRLRAGYQGFTDVGTGGHHARSTRPVIFGAKLTNADFTYDLMRSESWNVLRSSVISEPTTMAILPPFARRLRRPV